MYVIYCFPCFYFLKFLEDKTFLMEPLILLFWISVNVCPQFQNHMFLLIRFFPKVDHSDSDARIVLKQINTAKQIQI